MCLWSFCKLTLINSPDFAIAVGSWHTNKQSHRPVQSCLVAYHLQSITLIWQYNHICWIFRFMGRTLVEFWDKIPEPGWDNRRASFPTRRRVSTIIRGVGQCSIYVSRGHGIGLIFKVNDITNRWQEHYEGHICRSPLEITRSFYDIGGHKCTSINTFKYEFSQFANFQ